MYKTTHFFDVKIKDVLNELKKWAPLEYSEDFDNVGLLVGNEENRLSKCLISHDVTEEVLDEAQETTPEIANTNEASSGEAETLKSKFQSAFSKENIKITY